MENFKKSLFGGYKKSKVDAAFDELNQKLKMIEDENFSLKRKAEGYDATISELESKINNLLSEKNTLNTENENLKVQIQSLTIETENLKAELSKNGTAFKNIEKIYRRAYGAGHEIVSESKDVAHGMLDKISNGFSESFAASSKIIGEYELVHNEFEKMFASLSNQILSVRENANEMLKKAKRFMGIYGEMQQVVTNAKQKDECLLAKYDEDSSEFVNNSVITENTQEKELYIPLDVNSETIKEPEQIKENSVFTEPEQTSEEPIKSEIPSEKAEGMEDLPISEINIAEKLRLYEDKSKTEEEQPAEVNAEQSLNEVQADLGAVGGVQEAPVVTELKDTSTVQTEQKESAPITHTPANNEFTQFGRKSRISAQDRSELLRKALLKNGVAK